MFFQQQKDYNKMTMDELVSFFQTCHPLNQPLCEQCQQEATANKECKEANQERDAANKKCAAACKN